MSGLLKSRDYLMKCLGFVLLFGFISIGAIGGCNNNGGGGSSQDARALTERDFFNNPDLFANPDKGVVVAFLEPQDAPEADNLTGELGFDVIPYKYTRSLNYTYCFEDDDDESAHFMILLNSGGEEVLRAPANGDCVTEVIEPGNYEMRIQHGEHVDRIDAIFIQPQEKEDGLAKEFKNEGMLNRLAGYLAAALSRLDLVKPSHAQDEEADDNVTTLISTNSCASCELEFVDLSDTDLTNAILTDADLFEADLSNAILSGADLSGADLLAAILSNTDLSGADLSGADLFDADLTNANLAGADVSEANVFGANSLLADWTNADMTNADMTGVKFREANLTNAITTNTNFQGAVFTDANLTGVDFTGLNVSGADFTGATWTDGECICGDEFCNNCR
jgi:uncharacterized protein YjbI with pentapeptide repeats